MFVRRIPARGRRPSSARRPSSDLPERWDAQLHGGDWFADAKRNAPLRDVAARLEIHPRRCGSLSPCPACHAGSRGSHDLRGPLSVHRDGVRWRCFACGVGGSVLDLVSCHLSGYPLDASDPTARRVVRDWFAGRGYCSGDRDA